MGHREVSRSRLLSLNAGRRGKPVHRWRIHLDALCTRMPSSRREGLRLFEDLVQRTALWLCSGTGQRLTGRNAGPRRIT
jgi:hypothetical protein